MISVAGVSHAENKYCMDIRDTIDLVEASTRPAKLETTPLPYSEKELEPVMSRATIDYHYEHLEIGRAHV